MSVLVSVYICSPHAFLVPKEVPFLCSSSSGSRILTWPLVRAPEMLFSVLKVRPEARLCHCGLFSLFHCYLTFPEDSMLCGPRTDSFGVLPLLAPLAWKIADQCLHFSLPFLQLPAKSEAKTEDISPMPLYRPLLNASLSPALFRPLPLLLQAL